MLIVDKRRGDKMPVHEVIPTPSVGLNRALGGGLNTGATHLFWGTPSVGKTTMCFRIIAQAQKMGYRPVIIDSESSYNDQYAAKCGVNIDDVVIIQSTVVEDILKNIHPYLSDDKEKYIFLFDSISNIIKEEFYDKPEGGKAMGLQSRSQGFLLQKLVNYLHKERNIMLFVAHQTVDLSGMYAVTKAKMGNTVHHNMHNIIKLFLSMSKSEMEREENNMITSQRATWTIEKTKQIPTIGATGYYYVLPQEGRIDSDRELVDIAVEMDIINRRGAWYSYGENKWNGMSAIELTDDDRKQISQLILGNQATNTESE
jgi:recombination protein RecA